MLLIILTFFGGIVAAYFLARLIVQNVSKKIQPIISLVLFGLIIWLGYLSYQSVMKPINFNKEKTKRYTEVIKSLKVIREAQAAHRRVTGTYAGKIQDLVTFVDTAKFANTIARNEVRTVDKGGGLTAEEEFRVIDTVGYSDVRASFAGKSYKNMADVPNSDAKFTMKLGTVEKNHGYMAPVYLVSVAKDIVLKGMDDDLLEQEKTADSNVEIKGADVRIGSLAEVSDSGNWPPSYDAGDATK